ncbi:hypothetical protein V8C35DRAFT_296816 [Trichoderma chlorosporum]
MGGSERERTDFDAVVVVGHGYDVRLCFFGGQGGVGVATRTSVFGSDHCGGVCFSLLFFFFFFPLLCLNRDPHRMRA